MRRRFVRTAAEEKVPTKSMLSWRSCSRRRPATTMTTMTRNPSRKLRRSRRWLNIVKRRRAAAEAEGYVATPREGRLERGRGGDRYLLGLDSEATMALQVSRPESHLAG